MASKSVSLTMGDGYQTPDRNTKQQQATLGLSFWLLLGLSVCFYLPCVWYIVKLQNEVTSVQSHQAENTLNINLLRQLCIKNIENDDRKNIFFDKATKNELMTVTKTDETPDEYAHDVEEVDLDNFEQEKIDLIAFKPFGVKDDTGGDIDRPPDKEPLVLKRQGREAVSDNEATPRSDNGLTEHLLRDCRRACRNNREPPEGCDPCPNTSRPTPVVEDRIKHEEEIEHHKHSVVAAHFVGYTDTVASVAPQTLDKKNPQMATVGGLIPHWEYADWMTHSHKELFTLNSSGNVTVHKGGIYFVYSQVQYFDENDFTGHSIMVNSEKFVSCLECPVDGYRKYSTCYIGGVIRLHDNSEVGLHLTYPTTIRLGSDTSYFGFVKLV